MNGADVLIEMTNDGYLGNTPVLRQHLANAVFRAVETDRPVLRVTNVGITAYINEPGEISDAADVYTEATRTWTIAKSDGEQTFYVRYGDWFAWLCVIVSFGLLILAFLKRKVLMKRTIIIFAILILLYVLSYTIFRRTHSEIWEKDNQTYVIFPENKFLYYLFRPMVLIDGKLTAMQFHIGQHR